jgi:hypothetical protein
MDTTRRISLFFRSEWAEGCVNFFLCVLLLFIFPKFVTHLPPQLSLQWFVVSFFRSFLYHLLLFSHTRLQYAIVNTLFDTIQTRTRSLLLFNKCTFSIFVFMREREAGQVSAIPARCSAGTFTSGPPNTDLGHAADSLCGNRHCRWAHMQGIPPLRSLFHLRPRSSSPPRRAL